MNKLFFYITSLSIVLVWVIFYSMIDTNTDSSSGGGYFTAVFVSLAKAEDINLQNSNTNSSNNLNQDLEKKELERVNKTMEGIDVSKIAGNNAASASNNTTTTNSEILAQQKTIKTVDADIDDVSAYKIENPSEKAVAAKIDNKMDGLEKQNNNNSKDKKDEGVRDVANVNNGRTMSSISDTNPRPGNELGTNIANKESRVPDYTGVMWEYDEKKEFKPKLNPKILNK